MWTQVASHPHGLSIFGWDKLLSVPKGLIFFDKLTGENLHQ